MNPAIIIGVLGFGALIYGMMPKKKSSSATPPGEKGSDGEVRPHGWVRCEDYKGHQVCAVETYDNTVGGKPRRFLVAFVDGKDIGSNYRIQADSAIRDGKYFVDTGEIAVT